MADDWFFAVCTVLWRLARGGLVLVTTTIGGSRSHGHFCLVVLCHLEASAHDLSDDDHKRKLVKFHVEPSKSKMLDFDWPALT